MMPWNRRHIIMGKVEEDGTEDAWQTGIRPSEGTACSVGRRGAFRKGAHESAGSIAWATFQQNYLSPALAAGLIERTIPHKPPAGRIDTGGIGTMTDNPSAGTQYHVMVDPDAYTAMSEFTLAPLTRPRARARPCLRLSSFASLPARATTTLPSTPSKCLLATCASRSRH